MSSAQLRKYFKSPMMKSKHLKRNFRQLLAWDYEEGDLTIKTYVWLKDLDFAVIMKKYPDGKRRLITSFYVDKFYKQKDFERRYTNRIK